MSLTRKAALLALGGLAGLILTFTNPNFKFKDLKDPLFGFKKTNYNTEYNGSGLAYGLGYALTVGSVIGLGYNILTGNFKTKE